MFDFVPEIGAKSEFEGRRNVPGDKGKRRENPTDKRVGEEFSDGLYEWKAEERAEGVAHEPFGRSMKKRNGRRAKQDEGRNHEHQENVLNHMDGQRSFIEGGKRRADGDPEEKHPSQKSGEARDGDEAGGRAAKSEPAAEIKQSSKEDGQIEGHGWRPFVEERLGFGRHSRYGLEAGGIGVLSVTTAREASRAGNCPAGWRVLRKATRAVVSAGLRFLP